MTKLFKLKQFLKELVIDFNLFFVNEFKFNSFNEMQFSNALSNEVKFPGLKFVKYICSN